METLWQDLRYAFRILRKNLGFTAVAVATLALGIGANTALFSVVDTVLLRTLPVNKPEQLVLFEWQAGAPFRTNGMRGSFIPSAPGTRGASVFRYDTFEKLQEAQTTNHDSPLQSLFAFGPIWELTAVVNHQAEVVDGQAVSGGYYAGMNVPALFGRTIIEADDNAAATPVVVLNHHYWEERFGANPEVIGRQLELNKTSFTIIGVTPPGFVGTLQVNQRPAVTVPIAFEPVLLGERTGLAKADKPGVWWLLLMARLKPGATLEQARDSLNGTFQSAALEMMPPPRKDTEPTTLEAKDYPRLLTQSGSRGAMETRKRYSATIYGLFAVVGVVLLIACANVANLLLSRAAVREPEITLRLAVGAGRLRLIRQLLTESVLLAALGGAGGVLFAVWGKNALAAMASRDTSFLPPGIEPSLNWRVLLFTILVSFATGILFGLAPAWRATRHDLTVGLKHGRRSTGAVSRLSKALVVVQVALSLLLLMGAGLFIRTLHNLRQIDVGFNQENLLVFSLQPGQAGYKGERLLEYYRQVFTRLDALPGVRSATLGRIPLLAHYSWNTNVLLPGESEKTASEHITNRQMVRENYFSTLEIPLLRGRTFTTHDTANAPQVAIVNQEFGKKFFPNDDVLGKRVTDPESKREFEVVGVVADTKYNSQRDAVEPLLFTPWLQEVEEMGEGYFSLRTSGEPTALVNSVRQAIREVDNSLPVTDLSTQEDRSERSLSQERLYARLLTFFGGLALLAAAIGLAGVLAYSVAQRTNEMGVRLALGARTKNILQLVIWQGMKLVLLGLVVGAACGYAFKRWMTSQSAIRGSWQREMTEQLYGVTATDTSTLLIIIVLLMAVALLACLVPAWRATRVDPLVALRRE
ncbi:MAG: ABC transporter permease [Pyrinomonadaceae bacterium]